MKNGKLHNADIPYEQRMKYIIEGYRKLLEQNDKLAAYAKALEKRVQQLEEDVKYRAAKNVDISTRFVEKNRECKRLREHIRWLEEKLKELS